MSNIIPFEEKRSLATSIVRSGLFGIKDEAQALALMAVAEAEGMHPAKAVQTYHVIQGRPAIKADALLARFQEAGGKVNWSTYNDKQVIGTFTHPAGGSITIDWDIERAKRIGLASKDNWRNYPRNMLRARCIAEGVRAVFPGIATGIYTAEEVTDMPAAGQVRDMGGVEIVEPKIAADRAEAIQKQIDNCATVQALADLWPTLTKEERQAMAQAKEAAKARLSEVIDAE